MCSPFGFHQPWRGLALLLPAVLLTGCSGLWWHPAKSECQLPESTASAATGSLQVRIGGDGFALGDVEQSGMLPREFLEVVDSHLRAGCTAAAVHWIQLYPDVALSVLREAPSTQASASVLHAVAAAHDEQCSRCPDDATWSALMRDRQQRPAFYEAYDVQRQQFMIDLQNGRVKEALARSLVPASRGAPGTVLEIDALRLTGIAFVLDERPQEATPVLDKALALSAREHPYQAANLLLLSSDAKRRSGDGLGADRAWLDAVGLMGQLASSPISIQDPVLWERAAYLRPVNCPWPTDLTQQLANLNARLGIRAESPPAGPPAASPTAGTNEAEVWVTIGLGRLVRNEPQAALAALKRAESMTVHPVAADRLRLLETKALVRLGQEAAATALLVNLASNNDVVVACSASAMLGSLRLQQGSVLQGLQLLRRAVETNANVLWPERTEAMADLGLAYLLAGDEMSGLRWLHVAQQEFEGSGDRDSLKQSLENEVAYLEIAKKSEQSAAVRHRLAALSAGTETPSAVTRSW